MRTVFVFSVLVLAVFMAESSFAAKICLQDDFGEFWELKGGKIDKKSYTFKLIVPSVCAVSGTAEATLTNSGFLILSATNGHDIAGSCVPIVWSATVNAVDFSGSGTYDGFGDGTISGPFTLTSVSCTSLLPNLPDQQKVVNPNSPLLKKQ